MQIKRHQRTRFWLVKRVWKNTENIHKVPWYIIEHIYIYIIQSYHKVSSSVCVFLVPQTFQKSLPQLSLPGSPQKKWSLEAHDTTHVFRWSWTSSRLHAMRWAQADEVCFGCVSFPRKGGIHPPQERLTRCSWDLCLDWTLGSLLYELKEVRLLRGWS